MGKIDLTTDKTAEEYYDFRLNQEMEEHESYSEFYLNKVGVVDLMKEWAAIEAYRNGKANQ